MGNFVYDFGMDFRGTKKASGSTEIIQFLLNMESLPVLNVTYDDTGLNKYNSGTVSNPSFNPGSPGFGYTWASTTTSKSWIARTPTLNITPAMLNENSWYIDSLHKSYYTYSSTPVKLYDNGNDNRIWVTFSRSQQGFYFKTHTIDGGSYLFTNSIAVGDWCLIRVIHNKDTGKILVSSNGKYLGQIDWDSSKDPITAMDNFEVALAYRGNIDAVALITDTASNILGADGSDFDVPTEPHGGITPYDSTRTSCLEENFTTIKNKGDTFDDGEGIQDSVISNLEIATYFGKSIAVNTRTDTVLNVYGSTAINLNYDERDFNKDISIDFDVYSESSVDASLNIMRLYFDGQGEISLSRQTSNRMTFGLNQGSGVSYTTGDADTLPLDSWVKIRLLYSLTLKKFMIFANGNKILEKAANVVTTPWKIPTSLYFYHIKATYKFGYTNMKFHVNLPSTWGGLDGNNYTP